MNSYDVVSFRNQIIIKCNYKLLNNLFFYHKNADEESNRCCIEKYIKVFLWLANSLNIFGIHTHPSMMAVIRSVIFVPLILSALGCRNGGNEQNRNNYDTDLSRRSGLNIERRVGSIGSTLRGSTSLGGQVIGDGLRTGMNNRLDNGIDNTVVSSRYDTDLRGSRSGGLNAHRMDGQYRNDVIGTRSGRLDDAGIDNQYNNDVISSGAGRLGGSLFNQRRRGTLL